MSVVRLGAVTYLNARPLVFGLDASRRFALRFDVPSRCATLLHGGGIDVGLIPSIEYLRGPAEAQSSSAAPYRIVPGLAIASRGRVASVTLYTRRPIADVRSMAMDTSSRTSVALARVICARAFRIQPELHAHPPDLPAMLAGADAALIIGDNAVFLDPNAVSIDSSDGTHEQHGIQAIDLGEVWTEMTGLPFVYACWTGWPGAVSPEDVVALQRARDAGAAQSDAVAAAYYPEDTQRQAVARRYLRDNIQYVLGADEIEGLKTFFRYASELELVSFDGSLRFYDAEHPVDR